jgi:hypothetical protein
VVIQEWIIVAISSGHDDQVRLFLNMGVRLKARAKVSD